MEVVVSDASGNHGSTGAIRAPCNQFGFFAASVVERHVGRRVSILAWIFLGLVSGFTASKIVDRRGQDRLMDMALGVLGALVGGVMFHLVGRTALTDLDLWSLFVSALSAASVLVVYHAVTGRRSRT